MTLSRMEFSREALVAEAATPADSRRPDEGSFRAMPNPLLREAMTQRERRTE